MTSEPVDIAKVQESVRAGRIEWRRHALERMLERQISRKQVFEAVLNGAVIEHYPQDYPWPSALFLGVNASVVLHVLVAYHQEDARVAIVTVYVPDMEHFEPDFKTRKKR